MLSAGKYRSLRCFDWPDPTVHFRQFLFLFSAARSAARSAAHSGGLNAPSLLSRMCCLPVFADRHRFWQGPLTDALQRVHKAKEALAKANKKDADCAKCRASIADAQAKIAVLCGGGGKRGKRGRSSTGGASAAAVGRASGATAARRSTGKGPKQGGRPGGDGHPPPPPPSKRACRR